MPWFKAKDDINLTPTRSVESGERFEYPRNAGKALVASDRADWSSPPGESGLETLDELAEGDEGSSEEALISEIDWTSVDGVGPSTAEEIESSLGETFSDPETVEALLDEDLTDLEGVGPSTAEDLREHLEGL